MPVSVWKKKISLPPSEALKALDKDTPEPKSNNDEKLIVKISPRTTFPHWRWSVYQMGVYSSDYPLVVSDTLFKWSAKWGAKRWVNKRAKAHERAAKSPETRTYEVTIPRP